MEGDLPQSLLSGRVVFGLSEGDSGMSRCTGIFTTPGSGGPDSI